jgi:hypothetical protein
MSDNNSGNWDTPQTSGDDWGSGGSGDTFTETTHKSWFERIMESLKAILFGLLFVVGGCVLLFWNEGNSAKTSASLSEGAGLVKTVSSERADPANEGKLIHISGETKAASAARDPDLNVAGNGLRLVRKVEMYQWKEERKSEKRQRLGGGEETVTTYSYQRTWSEEPINSSSFREAANHRNPSMPNVRSRGFAAEGVTLGGFRLDERIIGMLGRGDSYDVPAAVAQRARERLGDRARVERGGIYVGFNSDQPQIGDLRVTYTLVPVQPVSVVGKQTQGGFTPYTTSNERSILLAETGIQDAALMFKHAQDANKVLTWILRVVGIFVLFMGFRMMLTLLEVLASFVPIFGDIVGVGASMVAILATAVVAPLVIAFAWLFYRPLYAAGILAAGFAVFYGLRMLAAKRAGARAPQPAGMARAGVGTGAPPMQSMSPGFAQGSRQGAPGQYAPPQQQPQQQSGGSFLPPGFGKK